MGRQAWRRVAVLAAVGVLGCGGELPTDSRVELPGAVEGPAPGAETSAAPAALPPPAPLSKRSVLFHFAALVADAQFDAEGNLVLLGRSIGDSSFGGAAVPDAGSCANDYPYGSDLQVSRLRLDGTLLSSWTLPGCYGRQAMTVDADGSIWLESETIESTRYDSTVTRPFLAHLSAQGHLLWSRPHPDLTGSYGLQPARVRPGVWGRRLSVVSPAGSPILLHVELVRLTPDGEVEQAHDLGALEWLTLRMSVDARGYVTVAGELSEGDQRLLSLQRWTPDGQRLWERRFPLGGLGWPFGHAAPVDLVSASDGSTALLFDYRGEIQLGSRTWRYGGAGNNAHPLLVKLDAEGTVLWSAASSDSSYSAKLGLDSAGRAVVLGPRFTLTEPPPEPLQSPTSLSAYDAATGEPLFVEELRASLGSVVTSPAGNPLVLGGLYVGGTLGDGDTTPGGFVLELSTQH